ncbi:DNA-processing protein DprA [Paracoccus aminophilus]|uniref:DNA protecting protein DprA n=1 Tax=Paracoccus aminophilus JCM 7686 TaxID=1367847 RepID=S5YS17_PARAH|nr:DNA-processing protein DprA [Paracoccus aminophilus]AGT08021.1 DNA protecting protein DprA [Paracoccus aminophilus JCM 7686]
MRRKTEALELPLDSPGFDAVTVLRLIRSRRVGPTTFHRLIAEHHSPAAALAALPEVARAAGLSDYAPCPEGVARAELAAGRKAGARLLFWCDPLYPAALREISDAPPLLWLRGNLDALSAPKIAVIGARNASSLGLRMARALASGLGRAGLCTVSGLARGIDTAVHEASLDTGTIAVMAGGIDQIYPAENAELAEKITARGLLLSEQPPGLAPIARHFPARNRIISALAQATVVAEAAERSGSLITARNALDQGREVMAVPGHPMDARAGGCNNLIRDGATLVRSAEDVLAALTISRPLAPVAEPPATASNLIADAEAETQRQSQIRAKILNRLNLSPTDENALMRDIGAAPSDVAPAVLALELSGELTRLPGGMMARTS